MDSAYLFADSRPWPDNVKITVLDHFLTGAASDWYKDSSRTLMAMTFDKVGTEFTRELRTTLTTSKSSPRSATLRSARPKRIETSRTALGDWLDYPRMESMRSVI